MIGSRRLALVATFSLFAAASCAEPPPSNEQVGEAAQAQVVCAEGETVEGIDVSVWQQTVDWDKVAASGIKFAFARASYGTSKDTYFDNNWPKMKAAGLLRGAYQYWLPAKDPIAQAQAMLDILGPLEPGDLPPVVDVEQTDGLGPTEISNRLSQWLKHVEGALGVKPIIYSGKYFWQDNVKSDAFVDYPLWIPNYSLDCPDLPSGYWPNWHFFQYTSTGSVNGVAGNVDRNIFNGSLQDLYAFASGGPSYGAKFVSQSFPYASEDPTNMLVSQVREFSIELKNTGTEPWNENTHLATTEPRDRVSPFAGKEWPAPNRYAQVSGIVMPGESYKFTWKMYAPTEGGTYNEHMGLVQDGVAWFSDSGQGGPPDKQLEAKIRVIPFTPHDSLGGVLLPIEDPVKPRPEGGEGGAGAENNEDSVETSSCSAHSAGNPPKSGFAMLAFALGGLAHTLRSRRKHAC